MSLEEIREQQKKIMDIVGIAEKDKSTTRIVLIMEVGKPTQIITDSAVKIDELKPNKHNLNINPCVKCGGRDNRLGYVYDETRTIMSSGEKVVTKNNDYINCTCLICGYSWKTEPLEKNE